MKKVISIVLVLFMVLTFVTAVTAKEGKKAKVAKAKGTIVSVEDKEGVTALTIQPKKGEAITFQLAEECKIIMGRKKVGTTDIKPQMKAKVYYFKDGDIKIATEVKVSKLRMAKKAKAQGE